MLNIHADEFRPASFQTLADLEELDEVDAANELLADLELLEMQEGIQRALDLVLDEPPTMTLQSFTTQDSYLDGERFDYPARSHRGAKQPAPHALAYHDAKRKQATHKNWGRRKC